MKIGSLFSGAGGLDMAVEGVFGAETVWHCEIDKAASKVLAARWPGVPNLGDITEVDWAAVEPVDILCGGFPCQDISPAGCQAGMGAGTRSGLWSEFSRAIAELRPSVVVIENVRNLLSVSANRGMEFAADALGDNDAQPVLRGLGAVLGDLWDIRYDAQWVTIGASDVGSCHRRQRVFIVANPAGGGLSDWPIGRSPARFDVSAVAGSSVGDSERDSAAGVSELGRPTTELAAVADLLPTPTAQAGKHDADDRGPGTLDDFNLWSVAARIGRNDLLPTPRTSDTNGAGEHGAGGMDLRTAVTLLPTPCARDFKDGDYPASYNRNTPSLGAIDHYLSGDSDAAPEVGPSQVLRDVRSATETKEVRKRAPRGSQRVPETEAMLPVVREFQGNSAGGQSSVAGSQDQAEGYLRGLRHDGETAHPSQGPQSSEQRPRQSGRAVQQLPSEAALAGGSRVQSSADSGISWGRYEAAIRRWEAVLGRPAPNPTEPNRHGNPRLNPEFSSWMMGWPAGWVTDVPGISRNDQLRIIGNGVVPQQATAALQWLLQIAEVAA
jgi:DNA-cytosine methyltransferase